MKKITYMIAGLLTSFVMASCSSDDETVAIDPAFPEVQHYEVQPEQVYEIDFHAEVAWKITSDKQWLKFIYESGQFQSLDGKAGQQTVSFTVTDGAQGFVEDQAKIMLTMNGKTEVIAELKRAALKRVAQMYTWEDKGNLPIDKFVSDKLNSNGNIGFTANFDWRVDGASLPEWLVEPVDGQRGLANLCGEAGQGITFEQTAPVEVELAERYRDLEGTITLRAIEGDYTCQFPILAKGIEARKINWLGRVVDLRGGLLWDDKGTHLKKDPNGGEITVLDYPAACHALIRDNAYSIHYVVWNNDLRQAEEVSGDEVWVNIDKQEGGKLTLSAKQNPNRAGRKLFLFLVPNDTVIDYNTHFSRYNGSLNFSTDRYAMQLEQLGLSGGFDVWKQVNSIKYEVLSGTVKSADAELIAGKLGLAKVDNIYERSFTAEEWNMTNRIYFSPIGLIESWGDFEIYDENFNSLGMTANDWAQSIYMGNAYDESYNTYQSLVLDQRKAFDILPGDCLYVVIRGKGGKDLGTFVIRKSN